MKKVSNQIEKVEKKVNRKKITGVVVKTAMDKTCTVLVSRFVKHPLYGKYFKLSKKYLVHDEDNKTEVGQKVTIEETRPISKRKTFKIVNNQ